MTLLGQDLPASRSAGTRTAARNLHVEPLASLEWARALTAPAPIDSATSPAGSRGAWVHRAPEQQVIDLYRAVRATQPMATGPWWLRALAAGRLGSRAEGFAVEDQVHAVLSARAGWVYVPWAEDGSSGWWEFVPSEIAASGEPVVPTTIMLTDRHTGWIDVIPSHLRTQEPPHAVNGVDDLRDRIETLEHI